MTQAQAIKAARASVGQIYFLSGAYTFNVVDENANAWREGPRHYSLQDARRYRARVIAKIALVKLGADWWRAAWLVDGHDGSASEIVATYAGAI